MRRTQHGMSAVGPSHGRVNGFRYFASRVRFSGKSVSGPSGIHDLNGPVVRKLETMYPSTGTETNTAAIPLSRKPSLSRNDLRVKPSVFATGSSRGNVSTSLIAIRVISLLKFIYDSSEKSDLSFHSDLDAR